MVPEDAGVVKSCPSGSWDLPVLEQHWDPRLTNSPLAQGCVHVSGTPWPTVMGQLRALGWTALRHLLCLQRKERLNIPGSSSPSRKQNLYLNYLCSSLTRGQTLVILSAAQGTRRGSQHSLLHTSSGARLWPRAKSGPKILSQHLQNTHNKYTHVPSPQRAIHRFWLFLTHTLCHSQSHHSCPWHWLKPNGDKGRFSGQHKHLQKLISRVLASIHSVKEHNLTSLVY